MRHMIINRLGALALTAAMAVSLMGSALAYATPDFSDVPADNWAYEPIMKMADAGVIKGTGEGRFSPTLKISPAMFLTLVGRVVFPDLSTEGAANWYAPYVAEARAKGVLEGTAITDAAIEGEITRYDMAVVLAHAAGLLEIQSTKAEATAIKDYGDIPNKYTDSVLQVYGSGLITGDQDGKFNGTNTMTRAEAATVLDRLITFKADTHAKPTEPEKPEETEPPIEPTGETVKIHVAGSAGYGSTTYGYKDVGGINITLCYKDGTELAHTVSDENGRFAIDVEIDKAYYTLANESYYLKANYINEDGVKFSNIWLVSGQSTPLFSMAVGSSQGVTVYDDGSRFDLDF